MNKPAKENESKTVDEKTPVFNFYRHYVKDISLEFPAAPQIFKSTDNNTLQLGLNNGYKIIEENIYEVELMINVSVLSPQEKTVLLIECKYAGLFEIKNVATDDLQTLLNVHSLEALFPYAREVISNLSTKTTLAPILLPLTNFASFYQQKLEKVKKSQSSIIKPH